MVAKQGLKLALVMLLGGTCCVISSEGWSQEVQPQAVQAVFDVQVDQEDARRALQERMAKRAEQQRKRLQKQMDLRIKDMTQVCDLSESQQKKLKIASKGAISQHFRKAEKGGEGAVFNFIVGEGGADAVAAVEIVENRENNNEGEGEEEGQAGDAAEAAAPFVVRALNIGPNSGNVDAILKQSIWTKTVDKTLSAEQKAAYAAAKAERSEFQRQATVRYLIGKLDRDLLFTAQQRTQLEALLNESLKPNNARSRGFDPAERMMSRVRKIPREKLGTILSDEQLGLWKQATRSGFGGGAFIQAAALPAVELNVAGQVEDEDENDR